MRARKACDGLVGKRASWRPIANSLWHASAQAVDERAISGRRLDHDFSLPESISPQTRLRERVTKGRAAAREPLIAQEAVLVLTEVVLHRDQRQLRGAVATRSRTK
jgi:hypothetical protein